jgi:hypothetical protein
MQKNFVYLILHLKTKTYEYMKGLEEKRVSQQRLVGNAKRWSGASAVRCCGRTP